MSSVAKKLKVEGNNFFKAGNYPSAIEKYMDATKADPTVAVYWYCVAVCHEKLGNWAEMADAGRNCVKADSKSVKGYFRLATAMKNLKNMAECIKTLESGLGVDSSNSDLKKMRKEVEVIQISADAHKAEGNAFFKAGNYPSAIKKYMEATNADPTVPAYWSNMAASHEKLGNWAEMADAGRNCVKADSKFVKGYFRLATAMKNLKNMAGCIKTLDSGLGVDSSNSDLKKMKKEVEAIQAIQKTKKRAVTSSEIKEFTVGDIVLCPKCSGGLPVKFLIQEKTSVGLCDNCEKVFPLEDLKNCTKFKPAMPTVDEAGADAWRKLKDLKFEKTPVFIDTPAFSYLALAEGPQQSHFTKQRTNFPNTFEHVEELLEELLEDVEESESESSSSEEGEGEVEVEAEVEREEGFEETVGNVCDMNKKAFQPGMQENKDSMLERARALLKENSNSNLEDVLDDEEDDDLYYQCAVASGRGGSSRGGGEGSGGHGGGQRTYPETNIRMYTSLATNHKSFTAQLSINGRYYGEVCSTIQGARDALVVLKKRKREEENKK
ncbi:hypothetical protein ScalyP_jg4009 [Parmales sp. scaly parma]|nr:hypothetical protein ScalyP_jg4009 [Parmales sp. scaly parma]